jgi:hypothetical protein
MSTLMETQGHILRETLKLREQLLDVLDDADLAYRVPGNPSYGELLAELGSIEIAYTRSFRTFELKFEAAGAALASVEAYRTWFSSLDKELIDTLDALSDADAGRAVDRGGWTIPVETQFHIFREAVLIIAAKAVVYLRSQGKEVKTQLTQWIG